MYKSILLHSWPSDLSSNPASAYEGDTRCKQGRLRSWFWDAQEWVGKRASNGPCWVIKLFFPTVYVSIISAL